MSKPIANFWQTHPTLIAFNSLESSTASKKAIFASKTSNNLSALHTKNL